MEKLNFRKRLALLKKETFNKLHNEIDLGATASKLHGYFELKEILIVLNEKMEKFEIDMEIETNETNVIIRWFDLESDKISENKFDTTMIKEPGRLPAMTNIVQSFGAVCTYKRRYALTNALNLYAVDKIENGTGKIKYITIDQQNQINKFDKDVLQHVMKINKIEKIEKIDEKKFSAFIKVLENTQQLKENKKAKKEVIEKNQVDELLKLNRIAVEKVLKDNNIPNIFVITKKQYQDIYNTIIAETKINQTKPNQAQITRLYTLANLAGQTNETVKLVIKKEFGIESTKELNIEQYNDICSRLEKIADEKTLPVAEQKFAKAAN